MLLWVVFAVLSAGAALAVLVPVWRGTQASSDTAAAEIAVHQDQLAALEREAASGLLAPGEAAAARTEIARRILAIGREGTGEAPPPGARASQVVAFVAAVLLPVGTLAAYLWIGAPLLADRPLADRAGIGTSARADFEAALGELNAAVTLNPNNGAAWAELAYLYLSVNDPRAVSAFTSAIRVNDPAAPLEEGLGFALVIGNGGLVVPEAEAAFRRAVALDPTTELSRYFLAVALGQGGRHTEAIAALEALAVTMAPNSPLLPYVAVEYAAARQALGLPPIAAAPSDPAPGPAVPDLGAPDIEAMVAGLAARLADAPDDPDGWIMLVRSYTVLGRMDEALAALAEARAAIGEDHPGRPGLDAGAAELGFD